MLEFPESYVEYSMMQGIANDVDTFRRYVKGVKALAVTVANLEANRGWMEENFSIGGESRAAVRSKFDESIVSFSEAGWKDAAYSALRHAMKPESLVTMAETFYGSENFFTAKETIRKLYCR